jgi:hypothetical protein
MDNRASLSTAGEQPLSSLGMVVPVEDLGTRGTKAGGCRQTDNRTWRTDQTDEKLFCSPSTIDDHAYPPSSMACEIFPVQEGTDGVHGTIQAK